MLRKSREALPALAGAIIREDRTLGRGDLPGWVLERHRVDARIGTMVEKGAAVLLRGDF